ncbi:MAG TPA: hypothetical protein VF384_03980 [Planctomycetota bacterium]
MTLDRSLGEKQYHELLTRVGPEVSPLTILPEPFCVGDHVFWCVESLWQGTKAVVLDDPGRARLSDIDVAWVPEQARPTIWFPGAGKVQTTFSRSLYFRLLKSGRGWEPKRNARFGRGNWKFAGHVDPATHELVSDEELRTVYYAPAFRFQLSQFPEVLKRLRTALDAGTCTITPEMTHAHGHLIAVLSAIDWPAPTENPKAE